MPVLGSPQEPVQGFLLRPALAAYCGAGAAPAAFGPQEHNEYVTQLLQRLNSNPVNTLHLNEWLSDPTGRLAQLIQPVNCAYKNARVFLSFPQVLWRSGLVPAPAAIPMADSEERRTVVLIAGAGFLEVWRYDTWSRSIFNELLPRFWQELLTSEE